MASGTSEFSEVEDSSGVEDPLLEFVDLTNPNRSRNILSKPQAQHGIFGAYSPGSHYGITHKSEQFPQLTRHLNQLLKHLLPKNFWNAIAMSRNNQVPIHKDVNNAPGSCNYSAGLGSYNGGDLWIHEPRPDAESRPHRAGQERIGEAGRKEACDLAPGGTI